MGVAGPETPTASGGSLCWTRSERYPDHAGAADSSGCVAASAQRNRTSAREPVSDGAHAGVQRYMARTLNGVIGTFRSGAPAQFIRFCVVGGIGYITNLVTFAPLVR